ncbi:DEAD/DEAH box helicase [Mycobacteroides abscessus]|uniref:SNF2-related protein n=1 Tax=unclassified Desemzia TaxID=2685243 RepID=UPI0009CA0496|nr:N-formylmethionyl-tRNA deformylase [Mycobacteroides abscessus subsp. abscessus]
MGLGKTYVGSEKAKQLDEWITIVVCQKSLIETWSKHIEQHYPQYELLDMTIKGNLQKLNEGLNEDHKYFLVVNYDLLFRRKIFLGLRDYTLILDESSLIQNDKAKRSKFVLDMQPKNVILLSGTPTSGKYENLWTQLHLLGWKVSKNLYEKQYVNWKKIDSGGFIRKIPDPANPYRNVERLKSKMRQHGAIFMKTEEVFDLPRQNFITVPISSTKLYRTFKHDKYVVLKGYGDVYEEKPNDIDSDFYGTVWGMSDLELIGDTTLTHRLYLRMLAAQYNENKWRAFEDLITSTMDRLVVFYNFKEELENMKLLADKHERPMSVISGDEKHLKSYELFDNSITFIQYQAGAMGLNLQKANKIIYFSLTEKSELFEQSKKRIHRIGQDKPCFYYILETKNSIEQDIYENLKMRKDYTDELFKEYETNE